MIEGEGKELKAYLVNHHDSKKVAHGGKEQTVHVVLDALTNVRVEDVEDKLTNDEEEDAKGNVPQRPPVLQSTHDKQDLHDQIDTDEDGVQDVEDDKEANGICGTQCSPALESGQTDEESDGEHEDGADAQQPDGEEGAVFVQLEPDEAVDHEADAERRREAILDGDKVGVGVGSGRDHAAIEDQRGDGEEKVEIEEGRDFFAACERGTVSLAAVYRACLPNIPTAVNLLLTWMIMMTVMIKAQMWAIPLAPWKIRVLATSRVRL